MTNTLTYSDTVQGWVSFYSYEPEIIVGMNSYLYSFKNGELYQHNSDAVGRNVFYQQWFEKIDEPLLAFNPTTITSVLNQAVNDVKVFKTIAMDTDDSWSCEAMTNIDSGQIEKDWFELKEGNYYSSIRRYGISSPVISSNDLRMRSAQGVGSIQSVDSTDPSNVELTFSFQIGTIVSIGDTMYKNSSGSIVLVGKIVGIGLNKIYVDTTITGGSVPSAGDFVMYLKDSVAESYGLLGYYLQFKLENNSTSRVELFSVESNVFKSYP